MHCLVDLTAAVSLSINFVNYFIELFIRYHLTGYAINIQNRDSKLGVATSL